MSDTQLFDDLVATQAAEDLPEATETAAEAPETTTEATSEWPKTVTLPAGERPEGSVTVSEFTDHVNKEQVRTRVEELLAQGVDLMDAAVQAASVKTSAATFYQAVKAQRNPLPHYTVVSEYPVIDEDGNETGQVKTEEKTFVPLEIALDWWRNKPTRGMGGGAARTEDEVAKRLINAGKKAANLASAKKRLAKLNDLIAKLEKQVAKYENLLAADGKTWDDAKTAFEASEEAKEADKEIGDNE